MTAKQSIQKLKGMIRKPAKPVTVAEMHAAVVDQACNEYAKADPAPQITLVTGAYRLSSHITHPAAKTPPTNIAKQYKP